MSDHGRVLPFPSADDDAMIAARLVSLYAHTPAADATRVSACARAVLARAAQTSTRGTAAWRGRWWWSVAAAAAVVVSVQYASRGALPTAGAGDVAATGADTQTLGAATAIDGGSAVRFDLRIPSGAREVAIVGDFNGWNERATPMARATGDGAWSVRVPLTPGRHVYAFVVDGERWLVDPLAPQVPDTGYGPSNALVVDGETR